MTNLITGQDLSADERDLEQYRRELTGYCYRMLGSPFDAEDAVQEALVRAWRSLDRFEGRSSLRSWLYRIATNVCLDMLSAGNRRARCFDFGPASAPVIESLGQPLPESTWVLPLPDGRVLADTLDPAEITAERESIRLAFVAALQHLPAKQRAVLILCEVLRWPAAQVAELLETSVASVNSALQRARATLGERELREADVLQPDDAEQRELLDRFVDAFERYDLDLLTTLLHDDATQSMPPYALWIQGPEAIRAWWLGPGIACKGSHIVRVAASGQPAFAQYKPSPDGRLEPWALHVLEVTDGRIAEMTSFLDTPLLFPLFGLPPRLDS